MPSMSRPRATACGLVLLAILLLSNTASDTHASDWPQFRGPQRNGLSPDSGLLDTWPEEGPPEVWRRPLGEGYSAISVVGDRLYTLFAEPPAGGANEPPSELAEEAMTETQEGHLELAAAFDVVSGKELWRAPIDQRIETAYGNGPRSTPAVVGDRLFVLGSHGKVSALANADGALLWQVDAVEALGGKWPYWGFASSILVEGQSAIVELGLPDGRAYVAFDTTDGKVLWATGDATVAGYNSPQVVAMHGQRQLLYLTAGQLRGVDLEGKELWSHPWPQGESHAMPIFIAPDMVFASGAEGIGAAVVRVPPQGEGSAIEVLWSGDQMKNHFSSSLHHRGYIYGFDNATLKCIEAATGELMWAKRGLGKGSLIYGDGHLFVLSDRGLLTMARATPEGWAEQGHVQALEGRTWTAPVIAEGRLYLRNHDEMVAYDLRARKGDS